MNGHVLHVITDTDRRGAQTFGVDLNHALVEQQVAGRVIALAGGVSDRPLPVPVIGRGQLAVTTLAALRREMAVAAVVVAHGSRALPACGMAGVGLSTPVVYRNIGDLTYWAPDPRRRLQVRTLLRRMASVVSLWPGARDTVVDSFGVPAARAHVIPNGVPASRCRRTDLTDRATERTRLGLDPTRPTLAFVGALSPEKDPAMAIHVVGDLDAQLVVAGDGPLRSDLEELAAEVAPGRVRFLGVVEGPKEAFAAADLCLLTSRSEGMPGVVIEAGMSGLASVATDVGAVRDMIVPGVTGDVAAPGDVAALVRATERTLSHADEHGAAARALCLERFEIGVVAAAWAQLLRAVVAAMGITAFMATS